MVVVEDDQFEGRFHVYLGLLLSCCSMHEEKLLRSQPPSTYCARAIIQLSLPPPPCLIDFVSESSPDLAPFIRTAPSAGLLPCTLLWASLRRALSFANILICWADIQWIVIRILFRHQGSAMPFPS